jgi:hypothetical protein
MIPGLANYWGEKRLAEWIDSACEKRGQVRLICLNAPVRLFFSRNRSENLADNRFSAVE